MRRNLETKARCDDLPGAARTLSDRGAVHKATLQQTDTYFRTRSGLLKLRQSREEAAATGGRELAQLIAYQRPEEQVARMTSYFVVPVGEPDACRAALLMVLGLHAVVRKRRDLWIAGSTRIHLDDVVDLGRFIELETVVAADAEDDAVAEHRGLLALLGIRPEATIAGSYSDL